MQSARAQIARLSSRVGLVGAVAVTPVAVAPWGLNPFGPVKLFVLCLSAALVAIGVALDRRVADRIAAAFRRPTGLALLALAGLFVLSTSVASDARAALFGTYPGYEAGLIALGAMVLAGFVGAASIEDSATLIGRSVGLALIAVGAYALAQGAGFAGLGADVGVSLERAQSTLGNASNLGLWCAVALPWAVYGTRTERRRPWRVVSAIAVVAGLVGVLVSGSRGATVAVVGGLVVWVVLAATPARARDRRVWAGVGIALLIAVVLVGAVFLPSASRAREGGVDTVTGRLATWKVSASLATERPFLGFGLSGFGRAFAATGALPLADAAGRDRPLHDPHNVVLSTIISAGPLAGIVLLALVACMAVEVWRLRVNRPQIMLVAASLAAGFIGLQFHFVTLDVGPLLLASLAVIVCAAQDVSSRDSNDTTRGVRSGTQEASRALVWWVTSLVAVCFVCATVGAVRLMGADSAMRSGFMSAQTDWKSSSAWFQKASRLAPWDPAPFWAHGRAARDAASGPAAKDALASGSVALERAALLGPGDHRILRDLGDLYATRVLASPTDAAALSAALAAYDSSLVLAPTDSLTWLGKGSVSLAAGNIAEARQSLERSVELSPRLAVAWANLAQVRRALGDSAGANQAQQRADALELEQRAD